MTIAQAETLGKATYNNDVDGFTHEELLLHAGMTEAFVRENKITDDEIRQTLKY